MPDRLIRAAILSSEPVNNLSWPAEVFYRRLMSVVDDFGRFDGRPSVLRAFLYPLKLSSVSEPDIEKWLDECSKPENGVGQGDNTALVRRYVVDGKRYLEIQKFDQRLRAKRSRWPVPPSSADKCQHVTTSADTFVSDSDSDSESQKGGAGENMLTLRKAINQKFQRPITQRWGDDEEHYLFEICKSPTVITEWHTILSYYAKAGAWKRTNVRALLANWPAELDKARNHEPEALPGGRSIKAPLSEDWNDTL